LHLDTERVGDELKLCLGRAGQGDLHDAVRRAPGAFRFVFQRPESLAKTPQPATHEARPLMVCLTLHTLAQDNNSSLANGKCPCFAALIARRAAVSLHFGYRNILLYVLSPAVRRARVLAICGVAHGSSGTRGRTTAVEAGYPGSPSRPATRAPGAARGSAVIGWAAEGGAKGSARELVPCLPGEMG
jgi:hypothetical protein